MLIFTTQKLKEKKFEYKYFPNNKHKVLKTTYWFLFIPFYTSRTILFISGN